MEALLMSWVPGDMSLWVVAGLIGFSYFTSAVTAAFGLGGGVMMLAAMASVMPALAIIPTHGAVQLGSNSGRAIVMRQHIDWSLFRLFVVGAVIGAGIGSQVVIQLPSDILRLILGLFILWLVWGPKPAKRAMSGIRFMFVGLVTSFLTMFVGATGLFIGASLSAEQLGKMRTVSTHAACAAIQHGVKVAVFIAVGFAFFEWLPLILAMVASGFLGTLTGKSILEKIPEKIFKFGFKALLTLLAIRLISNAVLGVM